ncbi:preprotein translocase subunit SecG [Litorimonas sp. WD9-15]|uniref:preprotein translocase subunit SecG n=1 Tax=Litorimonas sp. WD9-15 TaxID=3418716 RepID=UPI003D069AB8
MSTVLLIIQLIISVILTGLILIQRSEGGALGIGGGGGGGLMSGRSATTSIARMTGIIGAVFVVNCLALSVVYQIETRDNLIIDDVTVSQPLTAPTDSSEGTVPLVDETPAVENTDSEADSTPDADTPEL